MQLEACRGKAVIFRCKPKLQIMNIKLGLADDHQLFLEAMSGMLESFGIFEVVMKAGTGRLLQANMEDQKVLPDLMLIDTDMPVMNGFETTVWLQQHYPSIKLIAMGMDDQEGLISKMLKAGCCYWFFKDIFPDDLKRGLQEVYTYGYYNPDKIKPLSLWPFGKSNRAEILALDDKEKQLLELACTDLSYDEILLKMNISKKIGDRYVNALFRKFGVTSRLGLVLEASRRKIQKPH